MVPWSQVAGLAVPWAPWAIRGAQPGQDAGGGSSRALLSQLLVLGVGVVIKQGLWVCVEGHQVLSALTIIAGDLDFVTGKNGSKEWLLLLWTFFKNILR